MFYFLNLYSYREYSRKKTNVFNSFNSLNSFNSKKRSEFIDVGASTVHPSTRPLNIVLAKITIYIIMFARYYSTTIFS